MVLRHYGGSIEYVRNAGVDLLQDNGRNLCVNHADSDCDELTLPGSIDQGFHGATFNPCSSPLRRDPEEGDSLASISRTSSPETNLPDCGSKLAVASINETEPTIRDPSSKLEALIASPFFEAGFGILIVLNSVVMAVEAQYHGIDTGYNLGYPGSTRAAADTWPGAEPTFEALEWFFGIVFTLEVCLKAAALREQFVRDAWNWLDTVIVAAWVVGAFQGGLIPLDPMFLRLLRLIKLLRMLRLVRSFRSFDKLYLMTTAIKGSVSALGWSIVVLFFVQLAFALFLTQSLAGYWTDEDNEQELRQQVYMYYGSCTRAFLTMFELMLANWPPAGRVLIEHVSEWWVLFVLAYQLVVGFTVGKVIMGVFLQITFSVAEMDDTIMVTKTTRMMKTHIRKMEQLFAAADTDGNRVLDREELTAIISDPEVRTWLSAMEVDVSLFIQDADSLFDLLDDGDNGITADQFVRRVGRMKGTARSLDLAMLMRENREMTSLVQRAITDSMATISSVAGLMHHPQDRQSSWIAAGRGNPASEFLGEIRMLASHPSRNRKSFHRGDRGGLCNSSNKLQRGVESSFLRFGSKRASGVSKMPVSLLEVVSSPWFDAAFCAAIIANTMVMAMEAQYHGIRDGYLMGYPGSDTPAEDAWPGAEKVFDALEWLFGIIFALELLLKLFGLQKKFANDLWNLLDLVIVISWAVSRAMEDAPLDPLLLRLLRLARLIRMVRLFKKAKNLDSLHIIATSIRGSFSALFWSAVLLFLMQSLLALVLHSAVESYIQDESKPENLRRTVYSYFGTYSRAIFTMFEITLANWIPAGRTLTEFVSEWFVIFVLGHKLAIGFAVVVVLSGVFLQETFKVAANDDFIMMRQKKRASRSHTAKMEKLFAACDLNGNGCLEREEFISAMSDDKVNVWLRAMGLDVTNAGAIFDLIDDGSGELTADDLIGGVSRLKGPARALDMCVFMHESDTLRTELEILQRIHKRLRGFCRQHAPSTAT